MRPLRCRIQTLIQFYLHKWQQQWPQDALGQRPYKRKPQQPYPMFLRLLGPSKKLKATMIQSMGSMCNVNINGSSTEPCGTP